MPDAAALFHRLSGRDEARRWLADRVEIVPVRPAGMSPFRSSAARIWRTRSPFVIASEATLLAQIGRTIAGQLT